MPLFKSKSAYVAVDLDEKRKSNLELCKTKSVECLSPKFPTYFKKRICRVFVENPK